MKIKALTTKDVTITVTPEQEDITPQDYFNSIDGNTEVATAIEQQIATGNSYAWCTIEVQCTFKQLVATEYLGCCNYKSEQDFIDNSGYYQDMVNACLADLNNQIAEIVAVVIEQ